MNMLNIFLAMAQILCLIVSVLVLIIIFKFIVEFRARTKRNRNIKEAVLRSQDEKWKKEVKQKLEAIKNEKEKFGS